MNLSSIPDWLLPTILLSPALLWMFLGVGLPWALAVLPRADWRNRITVLAVALALGPALTTTAMFFIGTFGQFSVTNVRLASLLIAMLGAVLARRNRSAQEVRVLPAVPLSAIDVALIVVLALAILFRFWNTAYWPYTTYDEFWVYGYNAKIFMLRGAIPASMNYYPQLIPLTYTYGQLIWGGLNPHAARTVVPIFALGSILMAYILGARLFNRRVGLLTAAIWAVYPQHSAWSQFGDLEVPLTLYYTATVAFFALGWRTRNRRYIVLSGLMLGASLWTKPTAAALVESLLLIAACIAVDLYRQGRLKINQIGKLRASRTIQNITLTLVVGTPMGGMWYIRNVLYGHQAVILPPGYWQDAAQRSGQELGWPLLIAAVLTLILLHKRTRVKATIGGFALLLVGSLPSAFGYRLPTYAELSQLTFGGLPASLTPTHLTIFEYAILAAGAILLAWAAHPLWRNLNADTRGVVLIIVAFVTLYFVTWFWSYSYHPRLSFAIVPSMIVLLAALLDRLRCVTSSPTMPIARRRLRSVALAIVVVALAIPGLLAGLTGLEYAVTGELSSDHDKIAKGNAALMALVDYLTTRRDPNRYPAAMTHPMIIEAPGELRLPYFFPNDDIRTTDYPVALDQIKGVDYFVDNSVAIKGYAARGTLYYNQILASLTRDQVMTREFTADDKNFRFEAYAVDDVQRFIPPKPTGVLDVQIGDFASLKGFDIATLRQSPGQAVVLTLYWQALGPSDLDYSVFIHLYDPRQDKVVGKWGGEPVSGTWSLWQHQRGEPISIKYHTRLWQTGETIKDEWRIVMPDVPPGMYELRAGLYDPLGGRRLPVTKNGTVIGEWVKLHDFTIAAQ